MSVEKWLPIPGFEGCYEVSDHGRIRSFLKYNGTRGAQILAPFSNGKSGHLAVNLMRQGRRVPTYVHRAVLAAFVGPPPADAPVTRHLDDDPNHNRLANLTYGTYSQNQLDKVRFGNHNNARKTHCKHGHEFTPENTERSKTGRACRTCHRLRNAARTKAATA